VLVRDEREPPAILCVVDRPNWAHDRKTDALTSVLAGRYRLIKRFQAELTAGDLQSADGVLFYYWLQVERLPPPLQSLLRERRERVLIGVCSHYELSGDWRAGALQLYGELPRALFANNRLLHDELAPLVRRPLFYTPNGVDSRFFHPLATPPPPRERLRVGWAGSLSNQTAEHRGVHEVIAKAVAAVGAELCLAVREERWRSHQEMVPFYQSLDVYACASRSEGTPNPCLEAAACGVPLVSTAVGNMPELIRDGENGFLVPREVEAFASCLERLREDVDLRMQMGRAARQTAVAWDWSRQALRYGPLFDLVAEGPSS
jgi:glycosyltransferase involved in cell wall biosynthesis